MLEVRPDISGRRTATARDAILRRLSPRAGRCRRERWRWREQQVPRRRLRSDGSAQGKLHGMALSAVSHATRLAELCQFSDTPTTPHGVVIRAPCRTGGSSTGVSLSARRIRAAAHSRNAADCVFGPASACDGSCAGRRFRRLRQRRRTVGLRFEIGDDSRRARCRAASPQRSSRCRDEALRVGQERVEVFDRPLAGLAPSCRPNN